MRSQWQESSSETNEKGLNKAVKLYLIRHGQTDWNVAEKIQGSTDIPLNETGRQQAACLAKGMERRPVSRIYSSNLKRALETAEAIAKSQKIKVEVIRELREVEFGEWEGLTLQAIKEVYPKDYRLWRQNPVDVAPPGGETQNQIRRRCRQAVETILSQADKDLAIVAHGAILAYVIEYLMRENPSEKEIIVENSSITTMEYNPVTREMKMIELNDVSHLL